MTDTNPRYRWSLPVLTVALILSCFVSASPAVAYMCQADKPPLNPQQIWGERNNIEERISALKVEKQKAERKVKKIETVLGEIVADNDEDAIPPARKALRLAKGNLERLKEELLFGGDILGRTCDTCALAIIDGSESGLAQKKKLPMFACEAASKYWNCVKLIEGHCANHCGSFFRTRSVLNTLANKNFTDNGIRAALAASIRGTRPVCP